MTTGRWSALALLILTLCATALAPAAGHAATVSSRANISPSAEPGGDIAVTEVAFVAAGGEANAVDARYVPDGITFRESGAPLSAGGGCEQTSPEEVTCRLLPDTRDLTANIETGEGDDRVTLTAPGQPLGDAFRSLKVETGDGADTATADPADPTAVAFAGGAGPDSLTGGPGDDRLGGGSGPDVIVGGAGDDVLGGDAFPDGNGIFVNDAGDPRGDDTIDGGAGRDRADYSGYEVGIDGFPRPAPGVTVDLQAGTGGSEGVDADRLIAVEDVAGTNGADTLAGDGGPNEIDGGEGRDRIDGRGGDDVVAGEAGVVIGGAGDDRLSPFNGRAKCSPGDDYLNAFGKYSSDDREAPRAIPRDCEAVTLFNGDLDVPIRVVGGVARLHITAAEVRLDKGSLVMLRRGRVIGRIARLRPRRTPASGRTYRMPLRRAVGGPVLLRYAFAGGNGTFTLKTRLRR